MEAKALKRQLKSAKRLIEKHGWIQGMSRSSDGFCVLGAMRAAYSSVDFSLDGCTAPDCFKEANGIFGIARWNDDPMRTKDDVLAAFDRAIQSLDGK